MDASLAGRSSDVRMLRGPALLRALDAVPAADRDAFVDAAFGFAGDAPDVDLPRGAVPYLPAGVDEILALVRAVPLGPADTFVDLGSGLGRVAILVHLLTGTRARGIELQAHLVEQARATAAALGLGAVEFVHADATAIPLEGTVFFLYAPFNGELLERALAGLNAIPHPITVATLGLELGHVEWLKPRSAVHALTIYGSEPQHGRRDLVGHGR